MSRTKNAHRLIDQAAEQATTLVDQAAVQASALVDQMAPHVEAARERVVTEYVPQARKAGRKARKQVLEEYVPQARTALDDARGAITAAAAKTPLAPKPKKKRGRTVLKLAVLAGIGTAIGQWLRSRNVSPVSMYEAPAPSPTTEDLARVEDEAPPAQADSPAPTDAPAPEESLTSFFDELVEETPKGSRRR